MNNQTEENKLLPCQHTNQMRLVNGYAWCADCGALHDGERWMLHYNSTFAPPLPQPSEMKSEDKVYISGLQLFKIWSGNSYVWDALNEIEKTRWSRLALTLQDNNLASVRPSQPSLNIEKAAEEWAYQTSLNIEKTAEAIFKFVNKDDDYFRQDIANIIRSHFTEAHPSQPTDEQIEGIVSKAAGKFSVLDGYKERAMAIKQAILSVLALRPEIKK